MPKKTVKLSKFNAAYLDVGEGVPLVFLHGFLGNSSAWLPIMDELKGEFRCIALDLLGFGDSAKPQLKYNIWHQVEFLQEFLTAIAIDRFYLIGHSYGGWTAAAYALTHKTHALTLIAPAGIRDDSFVGRYNYLKPLLWESPLVDWGLKAIAPLSSLMGKKQEFQVIYEARQALVSQPVAKSFLYDRLRPEDAIDTLEHDIHKITAPTLVIAGGNDDTIPLWHCQVYADRVPNAEIKILENATHALIKTHSQEVARLIKLNN
ncbi:putative hydrolase or acyltransferase of alpha/beta superfamily [Synechococcus sp. PCC 7502]|uniref:alpha/beta fold hydrolase n=1 Tax=Synechococcus sp. PCC 7502 TaxID=1173263 RepID=UPI00029FF102|nr:alpha/beta hydrolase [Synechococcus sp. PCC 7502]AFY73192.1 putative hydrolase or acyltransferase of alpha/beta superfamily [Synechococcus sp. PCC 7502]